MFGGRILCEHVRTCVCFYLSNSSQLGMPLPWAGRPKEEGEAWRNMVCIVGLALFCFLSEWFLIPVGLERAAGSEGLLACPPFRGQALNVSRLWLSRPRKGTLHWCVLETRALWIPRVC